MGWEPARYADNREVPTGELVTCGTCEGRGRTLYDTGKRRPHDTKMDTCWRCKGSGKVPIGGREVWTIFLSNNDGSPTFTDVNPKLYTSVDVASLQWFKDRHLEWVRLDIRDDEIGMDFGDWIDKRAAEVERPNERQR